MVEAEEIGAIPLLAGLGPAERERLAQTAADLRLNAGEYAVNEGDERALFAVLEGRIEVVKLVDGAERVLGERRPGEIFGEVPITLGMPFPSGFRAAEPARVMRIEPRRYYELAAVFPDLAQEVGKLAQKRVGGLKEVASDPAPPRALVIGHRLDPECAELRRFLDRNQVAFEWVSPGADAERRWGAPPPSGPDLPAIRLGDGATLIKPRLREIAERLGLQTRPAHGTYDVIIVGGGPAGLAAAVYGASEGLRTIVVEREAPGGQAGTSSRIENYLGFPSGVSGDELASRALQQARRLGAELLVTRRVEGIDPATRRIQLDDREAIHAETIILATGVSWRRLSIDGFDRLIGKGIQYGAARSEAPSTHGLDIHIVGAGNSAGQAAMFFSSYARSVTILCRGNDLGKSMSRYLIDQIATKPNISVRLETELVGVEGESALEAIELRDRARGTTTREESGGVFVFIGADAETAWLPAEIARDDRGYLLTGTDVQAAGKWTEARDPYLLETSVPGIFACGDVRYSPVKRVAAAVGEGSMAIAFVHQYLKLPPNGS